VNLDGIFLQDGLVSLPSISKYWHGRRKDFFQGGGSLEDFSKNLQGGTKSRAICFFSLKAKKTTFLLKISKSRGLPFQRPYVLVRHTRTPATALDLFIRLLPCKRFVYKNASFPTFSCN